MFLADFFYPEAVPNSQLLHHVFRVSLILKITSFIATLQLSFDVASPFLICEGHTSPNAKQYLVEILYRTILGKYS